MYVYIGSEYTVSTCARLHVSDERLPWLSSPLGPGVVAALCWVPAQALVANMREAAPASTRPCIVLATHLVAAGCRGVPACGCSEPMGARLSPPIALSGVFPQSWWGGGGGGGGMVRDDGPVAVAVPIPVVAVAVPVVAVAVPVRCNGQGIGWLQEPHKARVWWQFVDGIRCWRECCATRRWRGGSCRPPVWLRGLAAGDVVCRHRDWISDLKNQRKKNTLAAALQKPGCQDRSLTLTLSLFCW